MRKLTLIVFLSLTLFCAVVFSDTIIEKKNLDAKALNSKSDYYVHNGMLVFRASLDCNYQYTGGHGGPVYVYNNTAQFTVDPTGLNFPQKKIIATCSLGHISDGGGGGRWSVEIIDSSLEYKESEKKWYIKITFMAKVHGITGIINRIDFFGMCF